jgi:hypothetical protein
MYARTLIEDSIQHFIQTTDLLKQNVIKILWKISYDNTTMTTTQSQITEESKSEC